MSTNSNEPKLEGLNELKEKLSQKGPTPPPGPERPSPLSSINQLIGFGEKITYTFMHDKEVGSIHFDQARGEIYYKGHNLRHMDVEPEHLKMLEQMRVVLKSDPNGKRFAEAYGQTLDKLILKKKKPSSP